MEELFIYLLKSSALIAAFFLAYHLLLRKETFFTSNRWFLLAGLVTSVLLPLFFIKKVVFVQPKICTPDLSAVATQGCAPIEAVAPAAETDWFAVAAIGYAVIVGILVVKVLFSVFSLLRLLHNKKVDKQETFAFVDLQENIAPFSFFNFIVFNSSLYTQSEMESILLHEKVHSQQKHSLDLLLAKVFTVLFWFNPFVWLYKKAIVQNLEYIADSKAVALIDDKRVYQKALLKVVTHQHCLSLTNHFYQSLIKKRIVMLNKNQSHKRNSWKYAVVIPALVAFLVFFQVKVIARELAADKAVATAVNPNYEAIYVSINKNSTDAQMKKSAEMVKDRYGIKLKFSKVKRNAKGEITGIKVEYKDKDGQSGTTQVNGNEPIKPIHFYKKGDKIGFGESKTKVYARNHDSNVQVIVTAPDAAESAEAPEAPEAPEALDALDELDAPQVAIVKSLAPINGSAGSGVYVAVDDEDENVVIVNGKFMKAGKKFVAKDPKKTYSYSYSYPNGYGGFSEEELQKIKSDALGAAKLSMKSMRPAMAQARKDMERARVYVQKSRPQLEKLRTETAAARERLRQDLASSRPDVAKARAEMLEAKAEMEQAKAELEQAKAELERAKAEMKTKK